MPVYFNIAAPDKLPNNNLIIGGLDDKYSFKILNLTPRLASKPSSTFRTRKFVTLTVNDIKIDSMKMIKVKIDALTRVRDFEVNK